MTGIERSRLLYLLWSVWQSGAAVEHNDVILTSNLLSKQHVTHTPISLVSLPILIIISCNSQASKKHQKSMFEPICDLSEREKLHKHIQATNSDLGKYNRVEQS